MCILLPPERVLHVLHGLKGCVSCCSKNYSHVFVLHLFPTSAGWTVTGLGDPHHSQGRAVSRCDTAGAFTYLCPSLSVEYRPSTTPPPSPLPRPLQSHSVLGCSGHSEPVGPLLFQICSSVSPPTVARPASLFLPMRVPGQGLACDAAPLPPQYLLIHWFLSCSLPQMLISDLLLPFRFCRCVSDRC